MLVLQDSLITGLGREKEIMKRWQIPFRFRTQKRIYKA